MEEGQKGGELMEEVAEIQGGEERRVEEGTPEAGELASEEAGQEGPEEEKGVEGPEDPQTGQGHGRLKALIEALIFASSGVITLNAICKVIADEERAVIRAVLKGLIDDYRRKEGGFYIEEVAGGYEFRTRPEFSEWVKALLRSAPRRLSRPALETLAMVAYRQPVTRGEIEAIRGVDSGGVLSTLMDRRLVKISGRKNTPGRPAVYSTTKEFLEIFDLKDLSSLPSLKEIEAPEDGDYEDNEALNKGLFEEGSVIPGLDAIEAAEEREEDGREEEEGGREGELGAGEGSEGDRHGGDSLEAEGRGADTRGPGDDKRTDSGDRGQG